jgi:iron complex outermembrane receptor protein
MPISSRTTFQAGLRYDGYSTFGQSVSPAFSIATHPRASLRLRASGAPAFRVPTFTELYYRDPANLGTPDLTPEHGWSVDAGADWMVRGWQLSASPFRRWDQDVIDWVKAQPSELWRSTNVRDVTSTGLETALARRWRDAHFRVYFVSLKVEAPQLDLLSKYVLEYAEVQSGTTISLPVVAGVRLALSVDHRSRVDGQSYELMSGRISRNVGPATIYLDGSNLFNEVYREISTVEMPGRWITAGVALDY